MTDDGTREQREHHSLVVKCPERDAMSISNFQFVCLDLVEPDAIGELLCSPVLLSVKDHRHLHFVMLSVVIVLSYRPLQHLAQ